MRKHKLKRLMTEVSDRRGEGEKPHTEPGRRQDKSAAGVLFCELSIYTAGCCLFPTGFWVKESADRAASFLSSSIPPNPA